MLAGWQAEWCQPACILKGFPPHLWGLWELLTKVITPIPAGMTVIFDLNVSKFQFWMEHLEIPRDSWDEVYDYMSFMQTVFEENRKACGIDDNDIDFLKRLTEDQDGEDQ